MKREAVLKAILKSHFFVIFVISFQKIWIKIKGLVNNAKSVTYHCGFKRPSADYRYAKLYNRNIFAIIR